MFQRFVFLLLFFSQIAFAMKNEDIVVFAASSMTVPLNEIVKSYQADTEQKVTLSFAASSSLARQLIYGAFADLYISANEKWMQAVEKENLIEKKDIWLGNKLVLVANKQNFVADNFQISNLKEYLESGHLAISDPGHVPLGIYSKEALISHQLWNALFHRVIFTRNARSALALVERGEAAFGIAYYTDAIASNAVAIQYEFSKESHSSISYSKALIKSAKPQAKAFYQYLSTDKAKQILLKHGFTLLEQ